MLLDSITPRDFINFQLTLNLQKVLYLTHIKYSKEFSIVDVYIYITVYVNIYISNISYIIKYMFCEI